MPVDYKTAINNLMQAEPAINAVAIIEGKNVVYSTDKWDLTADIDKINSIWALMEDQSIIICGEKYAIRHCSSERLIATSIKGNGHIVGVKDKERKIITYIEPDGIIPIVSMALARVLASLSIKEPYIDESTQLGQKAQIMSEFGYAGEYLRKKKIINAEKTDKLAQKEEEPYGYTSGLPFTARLMAYYRAEEKKRDHPLIVDPFAERLAGDITKFLSKHIRYSEMDYPIVRSYYIEKNILTAWCNKQKKSQIILLGAGLDTRAYRFKPLQTNTHTIFEIDFPIVNRYKEEVLQGEQPLCELVRISADISNLDWISHLIKNGFSRQIPTFWVLEGLVYYIEEEVVVSLLKKIAEISSENSQLFVDIMQSSRWSSFPDTLNGKTTDPFFRYFKWGLNIKAVPSFFATTGWNVSCSFADDQDQGRNVGQKAMIFVHGVRIV